ncbi:MAG: hypothetical protein KGH84_15595 [Paracoccaceae bacterium]|nr:hypothetical protein [Paracoccaceae bacterium]
MRKRIVVWIWFGIAVAWGFLDFGFAYTIDFIADPRRSRFLLLPSLIVAGAWTCLLGWVLWRAGLTLGDRSVSRRARWLGVLLFPPISGWMTFVVMYSGVPMLSALLTAAPQVMEVTVRNPTPSQSRADCTRRVTIEDSMFWSVCHVPLSLRRELKRGQRVVLRGTGSALGLYYSSIRVE